MPVTHQGIFKPNAFGGVSTTTLCGRVDNSNDDMNVGDEVSCKFCKRILDNPSHVRNRWVGWKPPEEFY